MIKLVAIYENNYCLVSSIQMNTFFKFWVASIVLNYGIDTGACIILT